MNTCNDTRKGECTHEHQHNHELMVQDVCVHYHKRIALENISFSTSCGRSLALIGPNGAGKSTLLKTVAGLLKRTSGTVLWRNQPVKKWIHEFAYLPQSEEVNWDFPITVRGLVEMGRYPHLGAWKRYTAHDDEVVHKALSIMELDSLENRQIRELSGGQQQRAFLARSLAQEAHVLLLDEPFTGLDRDHSAHLSQLLRDITHEGRLVIASHHDLNTAADIFDDTLLIHRSVISYGATKDVISEENLSRAFSSSTSLNS